MLTPAGCEARRDRMLRVMEQRSWDLFFTAHHRTVYYFSGVLNSPDKPAAFILWADGRTRLVAAETYSIERSIDDPAGDLAREFGEALRDAASKARSAAAERSQTSGLLEEAARRHTATAEIADATRDLLRLRKRKHGDEIDEIRNSLTFCATAYRAARGVVAPGRTEIDVYEAMFSDVVRQAGTTIHFAGDFASGERAIRGGGPPTGRVLAQHDLFPLDIFPAPAVYFGDTCRTFAAGGSTDDQLRAFEIVRSALKMAEGMISPGLLARDVYRSVKDYLDSEPLAERSFWHHLGHGIGFHGHEAPRLIPGSEDRFEVGDVFTLEPGVYTRRLRGGIRLEDNYLLTEQGLENLFPFEMAL